MRHGLQIAPAGGILVDALKIAPLGISEFQGCGNPVVGGDMHPIFFDFSEDPCQHIVKVNPYIGGYPTTS